MDVREWLSGGLSELERQRDDFFANYHQCIGAIRTIEATLRWLEGQEAGAGEEPAPEPEGKTR